MSAGEDLGLPVRYKGIATNQIARLDAERLVSSDISDAIQNAGDGVAGKLASFDLGAGDLILATRYMGILFLCLAAEFEKEKMGAAS